MVRGPDALVEPSLLQWAREDAGYSIPEMAKKIGTSADRLKVFEEGEATPTINQLRRIANACKRPLAVFFLPEPPKDFQAMRDFRRLPGNYAEGLSPALRLEIRKARYRRERLIEIAEDVGEELPSLSCTISLDDEPEEAASRIREAIGLDAETQKKWTRKYEALNGMRVLLEDAGVLVFQARHVELQEMRGFSIAERPLPVISVNISDAVYGRIFTIAHELTHLVLEEGGLCDMAPRWEGDPRKSPVEIFCNHVAGALLMPRDDLRQRADVTAAGPTTEWSDSNLRRLARRFSVSREAMLRRLTILGLSKPGFYEQKREQYQEEYAKQRSETKGFAPPQKMPVATGGEFFVKLALEAFQAEHISATELSGLLEVRLKHLPAIERQIRGTAA